MGRCRLDNVTHTAIGVLVVSSLLPPAHPLRRRATWAAVLASNLPDTDLVAGLLDAPSRGGSLSYLLHHRGHSHTLAAVPAWGALAAWLAGRPRSPGGAPPASGERGTVFGIAALCALLHIGADALNDYGVHPFWPLSGRWYYGDTLFIAEPLVWAASLPFAAAVASRPAWRRLALGLLAFGLALTAYGGVAPWPVAVGATIFAAGNLALHSRGPRPRAAWAGLAVVVAAFATGQAVLRAEVNAALREGAPGETPLQVVVSPAPGNPLCARALAASTSPDGAYRVRLGTAGWPRGASGRGGCHPRVDLPRTAALGPPDLPDRGSLTWTGVWAGRTADLRALSKADCRFAAFQRFARLPFTAGQGASRIAGDLRYDFEAGLGFAEIPLPPGPGRCPAGVPPWDPPLPAFVPPGTP